MFPPEIGYNPVKPSTISIKAQAIDGTTLASKIDARSALDIEPVRTFFWYTLRELILHEAFYMTPSQNLRLVGIIVAYHEVTGVHDPLRTCPWATRSRV